LPWKQKHRGKHPQDEELFNEANLKKIGAAINDFSLLLDKEYGDKALMKLVGDRYQLTARQRMVVRRISLPKSEVRIIANKELCKNDLAGKTIAIDGFNLLIFAEALLSNGYVFECRDGVYRDIASIHGSYYKVLETPAAIDLLLSSIQKLKPSDTKWYFDAPVSNSGKIKKLMELELKNCPFKSEVYTVNNPDRELINHEDAIILSSDRFVISNASRWFNMGSFIIKDSSFSGLNIVEMGKFCIEDS
jgi:hypothetical protein